MGVASREVHLVSAEYIIIEVVAMTSLAATLSVDARGPSALYIITDSRITWGSDQVRWDSGQKTFASSNSADVFGFCGDAWFPPAILRQILDHISTGVLVTAGEGVAKRHLAVSSAFEAAISTLIQLAPEPFSLVHGARDGEGMASSFRLFQTKYSKVSGWTDEELDLNSSNSYLAHLDGSGKRVIEARRNKWVATSAHGTSRAAIWSFCDALQSGKDARSGGPPQLVGLWRIGPAKTFGFSWHGKPYLAGASVPPNSDFSAVPWFNQFFERCDGKTGKRLAGAQKQRKPWP